MSSYEIEQSNHKLVDIHFNESDTEIKVTKYLGLSSKTYKKDDFIKKIIKEIICNRVNNLNGYEKYIKSKNGIKEISDFAKKVINNYWIQYQCDNSEDKIRNLYNYSITFLPEKVIKMLVIDMALDNLLQEIDTILNTTDSELEIKEYLKDFNSIKSKLDLYISNYKYSNDQLIQALRKFGSAWIEESFSNIDITLNKDINLHLSVIGKLGTGKSTLISVIEGYLSNINKTPPLERNISANGRGTTEITTTTIKLGNINISLDDTIGQGDPGKGYTQKELWKRIHDHYLKISKNGISNIDTILYSLDASIPRLDTTDFDTLEHFFIEFKSNYPDSLDWWKKITIILTKVNLIKLKKYEKSGGLPKYESKKWLKDNNLKMNMNNLMQYNEVYKESLIPVMKDWKEAIEQRIYEKVYNDTISYEDGGQSLLVYFNHLAKKYYPNLTKEQILEYGKCINVIAIGEASQKDDVDNLWDYQSCEIKSIPNFKDALPDMFDYDMIKDEVEHYIYSKNWFSDIMNKIYVTTSSDNFRLTIYKLNEQSKSDALGSLPLVVSNQNVISEPNIETNNNINFTSEAKTKTQQTFNRMANDSVLGSIGKIVSSAVSAVSNTIKSIWKWLF